MDILPTWSLKGGAVRTSFQDGLTQFLESDNSSSRVNIYLYEVTRAGWDSISQSVNVWLAKRKSRRVNVYCGLSNWLTEPSALTEMMEAFPRRVWVVKRGHGIFHPKSYIFRARRRAYCFVASNNLTQAGMSANFEMGARLTVPDTDNANWKALDEWESTVKSISTPLTKGLLTIYEEEYEQMRRLPREHPGIVGKSRVRFHATATSAGLPSARGAVMEVMPKETGTRGSQLQIPKQVAVSLFELTPGGQRNVTLRDVETGEVANLTLTDYGNNTRRLSIGRLTQVEKPRIIWFKERGAMFDFNIVSKATDPSEYDRLLSLCPFQTSPNSKRWGMYEDTTF
ncbi:MAG: hypothetical protein OXU21_05915 [Chloroflexota bacterium]|nr:hypothetical protein [Chloroflexota bacterium]